MLLANIAGGVPNLVSAPVPAVVAASVPVACLPDTRSQCAYAGDNL